MKLLKSFWPVLFAQFRPTTEKLFVCFFHSVVDVKTSSWLVSLSGRTLLDALLRSGIVRSFLLA
jgi:hypothetical protein